MQQYWLTSADVPILLKVGVEGNREAQDKWQQITAKMTNQLYRSDFALEMQPVHRARLQ